MQVAPHLKACPFCGSKRLVFIGYAIHCGDCSAVGPFAVTEDRARELWNDRKTNTLADQPANPLISASQEPPHEHNS